MELLLEWANQHKKKQKVGEKVEEFVLTNYIWCSIAEKIF